MKIVIENIPFKFDVGCRLLKLKNENCPYEQLEDMWNDIQPMSFKEIAESENISINTALGRMRYALINLRKLIDKHSIVVDI